MWAQMRNHCSGGSRISFLHWLPTSKGEGGRAPTYHFWPLFPENCMKLKRNVYPPLDPPMVCLIAQYKSLLLHVHHVMYFYSPPTKSGVCLSITRERVYHVTITHDVLELAIKRSPRTSLYRDPPVLTSGCGKVLFSVKCVSICARGVWCIGTHHTGTPEPHCTGTPLPPPRCWHPMATESHTAGAHPTGMLSC